ncbi:lysine--tRNA ligase [Halococcus sp. IIIV-5B]|uniref:lysine--tRNA ligase n=1 Tax=Halococcus sp. IIIV-5B TaxID=2321230 RepID=UPI001F15D759|nr:lysine--tRNA ligase [Halococcus sp. IIIV-5B]
MTDDDPYILSGSQPHDFWAESVADRILERDPDDPIVIKGGISPSGVPHLGNMNEILRGYFVAEALRGRGRTVKQVFTADDRDPLRKIPRKLADLDGNIVGLGDVDAGALGRNLGKPYTAIPDPFGCCDSYGSHFSNLIERSVKALGIDVEMVSNTDLYESGAFEDVTRTLLEHREEARGALAKYQNKVDEGYVPFRPICEECGHVTETDAVTSVNLDAGTVEYACGDIEAGGQVIEGCGHEGTTTFRKGKLPWRFEWPAQWRVLGVDFEPFGKDHAEGSWPSGIDIARGILDDVPPIPMAYEWFTLDGKAFSSSEGHVIMIQEVLQFIEPEVLLYFFARDPSKARDFSIENIDQLVDEFDNFEKSYFGEIDLPISQQKQDQIYPTLISSIESGVDDSVHGVSEQVSPENPVEYYLSILVGSAISYDLEITESIEYLKIDTKISKIEGTVSSTDRRKRINTNNWRGIHIYADIDRLRTFDFDNNRLKWDNQEIRNHRDKILRELFSKRSRLPYTFAAVLGMADSFDLREKMARREDHISYDTPDWAVENSLKRVERAQRWARKVDNAYNYRLEEGLPSVEFDSDICEALDELSTFIEEDEASRGGEAIQSEIFETARSHDLDPGDLFSAGYRLFFDTEQGPKLGPFLAELDRAFVVRRLRREG